MKIGLISDTHIPNRAKDIPKYFLEIFRNENVNFILHLGDINEKYVLEELEKIAPVKAVIGNIDYMDLPKYLTFEIGKYKIFAFHSDNVYPRGDIKQIISIARRVNANVVIHGHTHLPRFLYEDGIYIINPGSATGVKSGEIKETIKSISILEISESLKVKFFTI